MAQRFGGKFSPTPQDNPSKTRPAPAPSASRDQRRAGMLGLSALAFLIPAFWGDPRQLVLSLAAGGVLLAAAWTTREGLRAA